MLRPCPGSASGNSGRRNRSPSWRATWPRHAPWSSSRAEAEALLASAAAPIVLAPARVDAGRGRARHRRARRHAAVHSAAPPAVRGGRAGRAGHDQRQPLERADRLRGWRRPGAAGGTGRRRSWSASGRSRAGWRIPSSRRGPLGPTMLRRGRGYAPGAVAALPVARPILAVGADLKNAITLVVDGQAFVSQHIGDLDHYDGLPRAWRRPRTTCWRCTGSRATICWSCMTPIRSTARPRSPARSADAERVAVQHHRAHVASVLAERGAWDRRVLGMSLDGTGYGDDGAIWGGELFVGSVRDGFERVAHLRAGAARGRRRRGAAPGAGGRGLPRAARPGCPTSRAPPFDVPMRAMRPPAGCSRAGCGCSRRPRPAACSIPRRRCWASPGRSRSRARPRCGSSSSLARRQPSSRIPVPFDGEAGRLATAAARRRDRPAARPGPR